MKLNLKDKLDIIDLYKEGMPQSLIAIKYNVSESNPFNQSYERMSLNTKLSILNHLKNIHHNFADTAKLFNVSSQSVINIFDKHFDAHPRKLGEVIKQIRIKIQRKYDQDSSRLEYNDMYYYMLKKFHYFFVKDYENIYDGKIRVSKMKIYWHKSEILS